MAKDIEKDTKKHYPPAYYRYREKNPTISILLSKEVKAALNTARGNMSYAEFLKSLFTPDGVFSQFEKQRAQLALERASLENEKKNLDKIERFYILCSTCGKLMIFSNQEDLKLWNSNIKPKLQTMFHFYGHTNCGK